MTFICKVRVGSKAKHMWSDPIPSRNNGNKIYPTLIPFFSGIV